MNYKEIKQNDDTTLFGNFPEILSIEQIMDMLHIGKILAYRLIEEKKIKAVKIGREYKIVKASVVGLILGENAA